MNPQRVPLTAASEAVQAMRRIQRLSRILALACLILIALLPVIVAIYWAVADVGALALRANLPADAIRGDLMAWQRMAGALISEGPLALLLIGLWEARKCFNQFSAGQVFNSQAVLFLRHFAGWFMASVLAGIAATTAVSVLLTLQNAPGLRHVSVAIGSDQIFMFFFAGMVWLMAAIIGQGQLLAEENATFI